MNFGQYQQDKSISGFDKARQEIRWCPKVALMNFWLSSWRESLFVRFLAFFFTRPAFHRREGRRFINVFRMNRDHVPALQIAMYQGIFVHRAHDSLHKSWFCGHQSTLLRKSGEGHESNSLIFQA